MFLDPRDSLLQLLSPILLLLSKLRNPHSEIEAHVRHPLRDTNVLPSYQWVSLLSNMLLDSNMLLLPYLHLAVNENCSCRDANPSVQLAESFLHLFHHLACT